MFVLTFFNKIDVVLIAKEQFVAAIGHAYGRGVHLVAVAEHETMETASHHQGELCRRTVCGTAIEEFLIMGVYEPPGDVCPPDCHV